MRRFAIAAAVLTVIGCTKDVPQSDSAVGAAAIPATPVAVPATDSTNHGAAGMGDMAMTGDPDHDFLRMMSDHHKGMIAMAHETIESRKPLGVTPLAKRLDAEQDKEIDRMSTMLDSAFKDQYTPMLTPDNQAMVDALKGKAGTEYDRTFLENVIKHHQQAIRMIDDYLPKARMANLKAMAEKMKAIQEKEITEIAGKLKAKTL